MKIIKIIIIFCLLLIINSCIVQFIPETTENPEQMVVEGLITDQPGPYIVKLSKSLPLGYKRNLEPLGGCTVWISDDLGDEFPMEENIAGQYVSDSASFLGEIGRSYTLHINTNDVYYNLNFESEPMEMMPVPPIDELYYEKKLIVDERGYYPVAEGCQIYLNTFDPTNTCKFFRWEYKETWEIQIPFLFAINRLCWVSANSSRINIKNTSVFSETKIEDHPISFISNRSDRLLENYSMEVYQYSLNEDEYLYWEKIQSITETVGGLYDIMPSTIQNNIRCLEDPGSHVLGYFSVSARASERVFVKDSFLGLFNPYAYCITDTIFGEVDIPGLNTSIWILEEVEDVPFYRLITRIRDCVDCTTRGTDIRPEFWVDDKK